MLRIFTDGSSVGNGRKDAKAGYAVVYPDALADSWGDSLGCATNQTAELTAIYEGLVRGKTLMGSPSELRVCIFTDSEYAINCLTKWVAGWKKRDWKTAEGKPVVHRDLIERILAELRLYDSHMFTHVKAHTGGKDEMSTWNQVADDLARKAAETGTRVPYEAPSKEAKDTYAPVLEGIPLAVMGAPVSEKTLIQSLKDNLGALDDSALSSALLTALKKTLTARGYSLDKSVMSKQPHYRLVLSTVTQHESLLPSPPS